MSSAFLLARWPLCACYRSTKAGSTIMVVADAKVWSSAGCWRASDADYLSAYWLATIML